MFHRLFQAQSSTESPIAEALHRSQAVIEFETGGTVLTANKNFLSLMGYDLDAVQGRHHPGTTASLYTPSTPR